MATATLSYLGDLRPAFIAHLADRLSHQICRESAELAARSGVLAPERAHSVMLFLAKHPPATLAEIARIDGQPHQLLAARMAPLEHLELIERTDDPADRRRRPYRLTELGKEDAARIERAAREIADAMGGLFSEMEVDLIAVLDDAIERLRRTPVAERCAMRVTTDV